MQNRLVRKIALERLSTPEELDQLLQITTWRSWLLLIAVSSLVVAAIAWGLFSIITVTVPGQGVLTKIAGGSWQAIVFVSPRDAVRLRPGMEAHLSPEVFDTDEFGYLIGTVASINDTPVSIQDITDIVQNEMVARTLAQTGNPIEVRIDLMPDSAAPSGYHWSASSGPDIQLRNLTLCQADIVVSRRRLIESVLPGLD
jgi:hypothetical protein